MSTHNCKPNFAPQWTDQWVSPLKHTHSHMCTHTHTHTHTQERPLSYSKLQSLPASWQSHRHLTAEQERGTQGLSPCSLHPGEKKEESVSLSLPAPLSPTFLPISPDGIKKIKGDFRKEGSNKKQAAAISENTAAPRNVCGHLQSPQGATRRHVMWLCLSERWGTYRSEHISDLIRVHNRSTLKTSTLSWAPGV